ncbi:UDP-N-acetylmuramoylalanyl-D-glutamyl-2,6-diaminopimelate--D-alanyl-D-alanyl ligase [gamma proteobacterium HTCC5015]|nr:UDP-N-acetylmuramoylalanyl-D-glutamyl-2,6-diaminopimelate--D-alanyl-D-alanyl ligase [gamma proteobacterium HTCC5015]
MIDSKLSQITRVLRGEWHGDDCHVKGACIDTRALQKGQLFFALSGTQRDGHEFVAQAAEAGASAAVVERYLEDVDLPQCVVSDARLALGHLAAWWRAQLNETRFVALTGSNGKTTVKEMLKQILSAVGSTCATQGNFNNDLGLPLTLLRVGREHQFAVLEMGASQFGEIEYLTQVAKPDVALVNNAGPAHLDGFKDISGVARGKGEIYNGLGEKGIAIINADDIHADYWRSLCADKTVVSFGLENSADVQGQWSSQTKTLNLQVGGDKLDSGSVLIKLPLSGRHNARNAVAAAAVALAAGVDLDAVEKGLSKVRPVAGRMVPMTARGGFYLIDDTYNANPASLMAGIDVALDMQRPVWLALGDLAELGDNSETVHAQLGEQVQQRGVQRLFTLGEQSKNAAERFGEGAAAFDSPEALAQQIETLATRDVVLLVKGSRSSRMERVVRLLSEES